MGMRSPILPNSRLLKLKSVTDVTDETCDRRGAIMKRTFRVKRTGLKRAVRSAAAVAILGAAGLTATVAPANAGTNGQHVSVCGIDLGGSVTVWGTDSAGNFAQTPTVGRDWNGCVYFGNYWLKGSITIREYAFWGQYWETHRTVPVNQGSQDWYNVSLNQA
jgi:hypothetical protein